MENTSPKKLRAKLKEYLDLAKKEAIRIKRRSGQNYILLNEEKYNELKLELTSLQKRILGKGGVVEKVKEKTKDKVKQKIKEIKTEKKALEKTTKKAIKQVPEKTTKKTSKKEKEE